MSPPASPRVVVIEDDPSIAGAVVRALTRSGFAVELEGTGEAGIARAIAPGVGLVILDLMLPDVDGLEVLQRVRGRSAAPVIVLTARTELSVRVRVFEEGAVDYLAKPFFVEELLARVHARLGGARRAEATPVGPLVIDRERHAAWLRGAADDPSKRTEESAVMLPLTPTEFALLDALTRRPGRALSREELTRSLADPELAHGRLLDAHMARLRKKLGPAAAALVTVWGHGYRFDPGAL